MTPTDNKNLFLILLVFAGLSLAAVAAVAPVISRVRLDPRPNVFRNQCSGAVGGGTQVTAHLLL